MIKCIAECGLNWNTFDEAVQYAEKMKEIGVNIIKYQWVENPDLPQMNQGEWKALKNYCDKIGIEFICTPSSEEIMKLILKLEVNKLKIGSDHVYDGWLMEYWQYINSKVDKILISDGYYNDPDCNMYCVSLYPCDPKFIDFEKMANEKYIGFSDHTKRFDKEWIKQIPYNIQYYEKHITLFPDCVDKEVSLNFDEFKELVENIRDIKGG